MRVELPDFSRLREALADPRELSDLLAQIEAATARLNERLTMVESVEAATRLESQATAKLTEASEIRATAAAELRAARQQVEMMVHDAAAQASEQQRVLDARSTALDEAQRLVDMKLESCVRLEKAALAGQAEARRALEDAAAQARDATAERIRLRDIASRLTQASEGL